MRAVLSAMRAHETGSAVSMLFWNESRRVSLFLTRQRRGLLYFLVLYLLLYTDGFLLLLYRFFLYLTRSPVGLSPCSKIMEMNCCQTMNRMDNNCCQTMNRFPAGPTILKKIFKIRSTMLMHTTIHDVDTRRARRQTGRHSRQRLHDNTLISSGSTNTAH